MSEFGAELGKHLVIQMRVNIVWPIYMQKLADGVVVISDCDHVYTIYYDPLLWTHDETLPNDVKCENNDSLCSLIGNRFTHKIGSWSHAEQVARRYLKPRGEMRYWPKESETPLQKSASRENLKSL